MLYICYNYSYVYNYTRNVKVDGHVAKLVDENDFGCNPSDTNFQVEL